MKITLNDSIPTALRPAVEDKVTKQFGACRIVWMPSRFPRFVMLLEPDSNFESDPDSGSFFDSPRSDEGSLATMTKTLEEEINALLATKGFQR